MDLTFDELISIANEGVPFRHVYDYFKLDYRRSDGSTQCKCPFHGVDRHPSARIYEDTNSWFCFTCGFSKTPLFFYKSMMGLPLTDSVAEFLATFRKDILNSYPDLADETFSADDVRNAYLKHLGSAPLGLIAQQKRNLEMSDPQTRNAISLQGTSVQSIFDDTRTVWKKHINAPNFKRNYLLFISLINKLRAKPNDTDVLNEIHTFFEGLEGDLRSYND